MPLFLYHDLTGITIQRKVAPDIRKKLQKLDHLGENSIQDLMTVAERVYNTRETPEEKQAKAADRQTRNMARILLATTVPDSGERSANCAA